jgi:type I restriction enzyme S subunit
MAEEIYREWFVRLRFPGHEQVTFHKGIPEGWEMVKIGQAFQITGGGTPSKDESRYWIDGNINWYTPSDITASNGSFLFESGLKCTEEGLSSSSARLFPAYSVMMTSRATIGALGINTTPACTNQGFITCIPNEKYPLAFLYHWLKLGKSYFEMLATGSTFAELSKSTFKKMEILTPSENLVSQFTSKINPMFNTVEILLRENSTLQQTRDRLLTRLISGKLSVEDLDIQFPPSMKDDAPGPQG